MRRSSNLIDKGPIELKKRKKNSKSSCHFGGFSCDIGGWLQLFGKRLEKKKCWEVDDGGHVGRTPRCFFCDGWRTNTAALYFTHWRGGGRVAPHLASCKERERERERRFPFPPQLAQKLRIMRTLALSLGGFLAASNSGGNWFGIFITELGLPKIQFSNEFGPLFMFLDSSGT